MCVCVCVCVCFPRITKSIAGDVERLEPYILIVGMENGAATLENSLSVPEKVKHKVSI